MNILIVGSSGQELSNISVCVDKLGYQANAVQTGAKAIELFKSRLPDLVIVDTDLIDMDSFDCVKKLRTLHSQEEWMPIIFLGDGSSEEEIECGIAAGGNDYLLKPCSEFVFKAKLKSMHRVSNMREQLEKFKKALDDAAKVDLLTGIANRVQYEEILETILKESKDQQFIFSLLLIDVDHLQSFNDNFGCHVGDQILCDIAERIRIAARKGDYVARVGGDKYAVIVDHLKNPYEAGIVANNIILAMRDKFELGEKEVKASVSIGIVCYPGGGDDVEAMMRNANIALASAKEFGRNNFQYYSDQLNRSYNRRLQLISDLPHAIDRNELYLVYQPKFDLASMKMVGVEALMRWAHPVLGEVSPAEFIPLAEEFGHIVRMGIWALKKACREYAQWFHDGIVNRPLAINVSPLQLEQGDLYRQIQVLVSETGLPAEMIELELTETAVMSYSARYIQILDKLASLGVKITIDDFGTGYSSLSHLKRLPISTLKIDRCFVKDVVTDPSDAMIVKSVIQLAHALHLNVVAEGVENKEQFQFLLENGCLQGQGYFFSQPVLDKDFLSLFSIKERVGIAR